MIGVVRVRVPPTGWPGWNGAQAVHWFTSPAGLTVAAGLALLLVIGLVLARGRVDLPYVAAPALLTPAERAFFAVLRQAVGNDYQLFAKVRLGDILQIEPEVSGKRRFAAFGRISSKHADFVLCDARSFAVVGVVELDDRSHQRPDRQERDRFFDAALAVASVPVLRVTARRAYDARELREELQAVLEEARRR